MELWIVGFVGNVLLFGVLGWYAYRTVRERDDFEYKSKRAQERYDYKNQEWLDTVDSLKRAKTANEGLQQCVEEWRKKYEEEEDIVAELRGQISTLTEHKELVEKERDELEEKYEEQSNRLGGSRFEKERTMGRRGKRCELGKETHRRLPIITAQRRGKMDKVEKKKQEAQDHLRELANQNRNWGGHCAREAQWFLEGVRGAQKGKKTAYFTLETKLRAMEIMTQMRRNRLMEEAVVTHFSQTQATQARGDA